MKIGILSLAVLAALFAGCATHHPIQAPPIGLGLGDFPAIQYLPPEQARRVRVAPQATRTGDISRADWNAIVSIISRLPDVEEPGDDAIRILEVVCYGCPTVAVRVQFGSHLVQFVKTDQATWKVASVSWVFGY